jgi:hypothetical protein
VSFVWYSVFVLGIALATFGFAWVAALRGADGYAAEPLARRGADIRHVGGGRPALDENLPAVLGGMVAGWR